MTYKISTWLLTEITAMHHRTSRSGVTHIYIYTHCIIYYKSRVIPNKDISAFRCIKVETLFFVYSVVRRYKPKPHHNESTFLINLYNVFSSLFSSARRNSRGRNYSYSAQSAAVRLVLRYG